MVDTTSDTSLPHAENVPAGEEARAVPPTPSESGSLAKLLSEATGRIFKTDEDALRSVGETFKFVGDTGKYKGIVNSLKQHLNTDEKGVFSFMENLAQNPQEQLTPAPVAQTQAPAPQNSELAAMRKELDEINYFKAHPEMEAFKDSLVGLRDSTGKSLAEVAEMPAVKPLLEKARASVESESVRSVIHSSPRLGQVSDKVTESRDLLAKAGETGDPRYERQAHEAAVEAVIGAYDMRG